MPKLVPIVEGPGEVSAVPILINRSLQALGCSDIHVATPKNAHGKGNLTKSGGLEKFVRHAWKERDCGAIFILLDADQDCPKELAAGFSERIEKLGTPYPVVTVCAKRMYETWLVAGVEEASGKELDGRPGLSANLQAPEDVEDIANAKAWLNSRFSRGRTYKETEDQAALTRLFSIGSALERSRSFRRFHNAVSEAVQAIKSHQRMVTPSPARTKTPPGSKSGAKRRQITEPAPSPPSRPRA